MFEKASRLKLRFSTPQGQLSVEDLWDLPLSSNNTNRANLDDIAKGLHRLLKNDDNVSFVHKATPAESGNQLAFDIVKHVIEVRLAEAELAEKSKANRARKQHILSLIADKQDKELGEKSVEELLALVGELS